MSMMSGTEYLRAVRVTSEGKIAHGDLQKN